MARRKHGIKDKAGNALSHTNKNQSLLLKRDGSVESKASKADLDVANTDEALILSGDKGNLRAGELTEHNISVLNNVKADVNHTHAEHYTKSEMDATVSDINNAASTEATARAAADSTLQTQVSDLDTRTTENTNTNTTQGSRITALETAPAYAPLTTSPTAPANPNVGDQWWDTMYNALMIYIDDGDSTQWMDITTDIGDTMTYAEAEARYVKRGGDTMTGNLHPETDNVHSLGSPLKRWKDVYIGPGSLYIGDQKVLESDADTIVVTADTNQNVSIRTKGTGDLELTTDTGAIQLKADMMVTPGKGFNTSNGSKVPFISGISVAGETIEQVAEPVNSTDAATKAYVDAQTAGVDLSGIANNATDIAALQTAVAGNDTDISNIQAAMSTDSERLQAVADLTAAFEAGDTTLDGALTTVINGKANDDLSNVGTLPASVVTQLKGDTGATGPQGPQGPQGVAGNDGATGPAGTPVNVSVVSSGNPSGGSDGDLWFITV